MSDVPFVAPEPVVDEIYDITRKLARHISEMCPADGDRRFKPNIDGMIKAAIIAGTFRGSDWIIVYCIEESRWYRLNGKHSSLLFSDENIPIKKPSGKVFKCRYIEYEVQTWDDVVDLNDEIDRRESSRSVEDDYRNRSARIVAMDGANDTLIKMIVGGLAHVHYGVGFGANSTSKQRGILLKENQDFCAFAMEILGSKKKFFQMTAVVAAMVDSFTEDPEAALIFWSSARDGSNTDAKSTERKFQLYLIDQKASVRNGRWTHALKVACRAKCGAAWKRWYKAWVKNSPTPRKRLTKVTSRTKSSTRTATRRQAAKKGLK